MIQSALSRLIKDKTVLVIAHRMRTIEGANNIVVLQEGKVEVLLNNKRIYHHMVGLQMRGSN